MTLYYYIVGVDGSQKCVYLAGNSLGLQPVGVKRLVSEEVEKWKSKLANSMMIVVMMYALDAGKCIYVPIGQ